MKVDEQLAALGARLLEDLDEIADEMCKAILAGVPAYGTGIISVEDLRQACVDNARLMLGSLGRPGANSSPESREMGRKRASDGVPLAAIMTAYRIGSRCVWERVASLALRTSVSADVSLRAASELWQALDTFTQEMADGYRDEVTSQLVSREQERSALLQAVLEGQVGEPTIWEAADLLGLTAHGPYVVIVASVPDVARHALPQVERLLRSANVASVWRLLHDVEVGVACLSQPGVTVEKVAEVIGSKALGTCRAGVSPLFSDLASTPEALRLARIALHSAYSEQPVTIFDRDPLAVASASAPDIMRRVAATTLAGLAVVSSEERAILLRTFGVWRDSGGSAKSAAGLLFVHPNTVRHRLRKLEQYTGRSLDDPRWVAELSLAYEVDRRTSAVEE